MPPKTIIKATQNTQVTVSRKNYNFLESSWFEVEDTVEWRDERQAQSYMGWFRYEATASRLLRIGREVQKNPMRKLESSAVSSENLPEDTFA